MSKSTRPALSYEIPEISAYRSYPHYVTQIGLKAYELGLFQFLYFRANDKTYKSAKNMGKAAYWSYSKLSQTLDLSRVKISQSIQLFENTGLIAMISRPKQRLIHGETVTYVSKRGTEGTIYSNIYAAFAVIQPDQVESMARVVDEERFKLEKLYLPDGRLRKPDKGLSTK